MKKTKINVTYQGDVLLAHNYGYMVLGNHEAVCFFIDPEGRAEVIGWMNSEGNCPVIFLEREGGENATMVEFSDYPGWNVHACNSGKTISVALTNPDA
jgi:hypothetical protein